MASTRIPAADPALSAAWMIVAAALLAPIGCEAGPSSGALGIRTPAVWVRGEGGAPLPNALDDLATIENLGSVAGAAPRGSGSARLIVGEREVAVALVGLAPLREAEISALPGPLADGRPLSAEPGMELVVGARLARELAVGVGATVRLDASDEANPSRFEAYTIVGVSQIEAAPGPTPSAWVHIGDLQDLTGLDDAFHSILVLPREGIPLNDLANELRSRLPDRGVIVEVSSGPNAGSIIQALASAVSAAAALWGLWVIIGHLRRERP